jgi:restriction system protein
LPSAVDRSIDLRFSALDAAWQGVVSVLIDDSIELAGTRMALNDYSQLAAVDNDGVVHGVISWKSIGCKQLGGKPSFVHECLEPPNFVNLNDFLLPWVPFISERDFVLVRDGANPLRGIVTAADLSLEFGHLARPYLLLSEVELRLRQMLAAAVAVDDMVVRVNGRTLRRNVGSVEDLTLYQVQRLMDDGDVWERLGLGASRDEFIFALDHVRKVRNAIIHLDSDSPTEDQVVALDNFAKTLRCLATQQTQSSGDIAST